MGIVYREATAVVETTDKGERIVKVSVTFGDKFYRQTDVIRLSAVGVDSLLLALGLTLNELES